MCVYNNKIYQVSGGWYGDALPNFTYTRDVYSTTDGINWSVENLIPMPGVQYANTIVFDNKLWCIAGNSVVSGVISDANNKSDVCYMDKKGQWHKMEHLPTDPKTHASSLIVRNNSILMVEGNQLNSVYQLKK
jgi:N-acetylneuraminic acid mutarotase